MIDIDDNHNNAHMRVKERVTNHDEQNSHKSVFL